tara:strand:+ start:1447 stop:1656 length:210 start_codon:yes stop_codon:yes gene_type:complete
MADYTAASSGIESAIGNDLVEEYEIGNGKRRVKRGSIKDQIDASARLEGLVARRAGGMLNLAKMQEPTN